MPTPSGVEGAPAAPTILVVDDERNIRRTLDLVLRGEGYEVLEAPDAEQAQSILEGGERHLDLAILDVVLPGKSGLDLLERLRRDAGTRDLPVIVISGNASRDDVAHALALGASDFFEKPLNRERVLVSVKNVLRVSRLAREVASLSAEVEARYEMIGQSPAMRRVFAEIERVAPTHATVLVTGATGTGKELICRALHRLSARAEGPFVKVNCGSMARSLFESELFGHERGAFTDATVRKRGLFEAAHGGTLLLDEVCDMDLAAQAKVLRALEEGEVTRLGGERAIKVDVRVLAATNKDPQAAVASGRLREDLYFRLAVYPIHSPALAERPEDVRPLAEAMLEAFCKENGLKAKTMSPEVYAEIGRRRFPGNVRELRNVIERAAILAGDVVTVADLPEDPHRSPFDEEEAEESEPAETGERVTPVQAAATVGAGEEKTAAEETGPRWLPLRVFRDRAERGYIVQVLASQGWNVKRSAIVLDVERTTLTKKIRGYGIKRGEKPS
jgi:DNA-binding NtrC family response regulator